MKSCATTHSAAKTRLEELEKEHMDLKAKHKKEGERDGSPKAGFGAVFQERQQVHEVRGARSRSVLAGVLCHVHWPLLWLRSVGPCVQP